MSTLLSYIITSASTRCLDPIALSRQVCVCTAPAPVTLTGHGEHIVRRVQLVAAKVIEMHKQRNRTH